jgi:hypothetical protein
MTIVANGKIIAGKLVLNDASAFQSLTKQLPEGASVTLELSEGESYGQTLMQYYEYVVKPYLLLVFVSKFYTLSESATGIDIDTFMRINFAEKKKVAVLIEGNYENVVIHEPISPENIESLLTKLNAWLKELGLKLPKRNPDTYQR